MVTDLRLDAPSLPAQSSNVWQASRPSSLGRRLLAGAVLAWFAILILVPSLALVRQVLLGGLKPFLQAVARPEVQRAFGMSLGITGLATVVNTVFGIGLALVLTRATVLGPRPGRRHGRFALRHLADRRWTDARRALWTRRMAGPLA